MQENLHPEFVKIQAELARILNEIPFNRIIGLQLGEVHQDYISLNFVMKKELVGNYLYGILHGGVISAALDMAGGVAVMMAAVKKHPGKSLKELAEILGKSSTVNLHIEYLHPGKGEHFTAKAYVIRSGNKISFARMELYNEAATFIANGSGTYLIG